MTTLTLSTQGHWVTSVGCFFWLNNRRCVVDSVMAPNGEESPHYQFSTVDNGAPVCGLVPTDIIGRLELTK